MLTRWRPGAPADVAWPQLQVAGDTATVVADPTGGSRVYAAVSGAELVVSDDLGAIALALNRDGVATPLNHTALSHVLVHGFGMLPETVFSGILQPRMGESIHARKRGDGLGIEAVDDGYPYLNGASREDQVADERRLLDLTTAAVDRIVVREGGSGVLMLSSGKDSVALALAVAEGGHRDVTCVTYRSSERDSEWQYAASLCRRLGLALEILDPPKPDEIRRILERVFERSAEPGGEGLFQYGHMAKVLSPEYPFVMDGLGNDTFMGFGPNKRGRWKTRLRVRGALPGAALTMMTPVDSPLNYFLRSRVATTFPLRLLRDRELNRIYPESVRVQRLAYDQSRALRHMDDWDLWNEVSERTGNVTSSMLKVYLTTQAYDMRATFPFCDTELIDYYFNLPQAERFDRKALTNKVLLRKMLTRYADYDTELVGSNPFHFDRVRFLQEQRDWVLAEIAACTLWNDRAAPMAQAWLDALDRRRLLAHALLPLFQVSGWHNRSSVLRESRHLTSAPG